MSRLSAVFFARLIPGLKCSRGSTSPNLRKCTLGQMCHSKSTPKTFKRTWKGFSSVTSISVTGMSVNMPGAPAVVFISKFLRLEVLEMPFLLCFYCVFFFKAQAAHNSLSIVTPNEDSPPQKIPNTMPKPSNVSSTYGLHFETQQWIPVHRKGHFF